MEKDSSFVEARLANSCIAMRQSPSVGPLSKATSTNTAAAAVASSLRSRVPIKVLHLLVPNVFGKYFINMSDGIQVEYYVPRIFNFSTNAESFSTLESPSRLMLNPREMYVVRISRFTFVRIGGDIFRRFSHG